MWQNIVISMPLETKTNVLKPQVIVDVCHLDYVQEQSSSIDRIRIPIRTDVKDNINVLDCTICE